MILYDFSLNQLNGNPIDWNDFQGKKVLLVNVASQCGLTPQYTQLQELQEEFGGNDFAVLGVPCNDFAGQEPGTSEEIAVFCSTNYGVSFPLSEKVHTVGEEIHPIYKWLKDETGADVTWNFQKFLIDEEGKVTGFYSPQTEPADSHILDWIKKS
ncbi:glutathione peroxidase [Fluviicola taffensis]|uniref:Glutathione peroxidase n=1 Tax=Fluviicola taffensis (strain DSM 16823 / NCIMB 13979 / RW262) TaxID=755732 RepID=F2IHQ5_FLUTR|nr:glutathione peroxidase [Fluviicola taffensis]AEA44833.1 Peroxiredoxin [Fluviicola taffensis DSM 16823]